MISVQSVWDVSAIVGIAKNTVTAVTAAMKVYPIDESSIFYLNSIVTCVYSK